MTATYSDSSTKAVTDYTIGSYANDEAETVTVTISYTEGEVTKTADLSVTFAAAAAGKTIYFSNNKNWTSVYAYVWNSADTDHPEATWPGNACTLVGTNELGESVFSYTVADDYNYVIFSNGSGTQTEDILVDDDSSGYYCNTWDGSKWTVGTYTYGA